MNPDFPQQLIGLYSPRPGSGKTTVARMLYARGFERIPFAETLKSMTYTLLCDLGIEPKEAFRLIHEDKAEVIPLIGVNTRHLMRTLGTEWGRECVHPELWLRAWQQKIRRYPRVVVDDIRFLNEAKLVQQLGGQVWKVTRPGLVDASDLAHASEGSLDDWTGFHREIVNDECLAVLGERVYAAYSEAPGDTLAAAA